MRLYFNLLLFVPLFFLTTQCTKKKAEKIETKINELKSAEHYNMEDFKKVHKIDIHVHINSETKVMINLAKANNFRLFNIAVDANQQEYLSIKEQVKISYNLQKENPDIVIYGTAFSLNGWNNSDWSDKAISQLKSDFDLGAVSVKTWKNIGMEAKDKDGNLIFIDDPKFDPIFKFIKDQSKVLMSHAGEPKNCWLPLDSMTVNNDRNYFKEHPEYHMHLHPELPSYEDQIMHRDNMLVKNPDLTFIGVHIASLEWSVDKAAKFLDRFPNASVDLAARISNTQYQSQKNRKKVRNFFIKYQDRILYGTDLTEGETTNAIGLEKNIMEVWQSDWKYFNTDEMITVPQLDKPVQGLALPKEVVDKIYHLNAEKIFTDAWK